MTYSAVLRKSPATSHSRTHEARDNAATLFARLLLALVMAMSLLIAAPAASQSASDTQQTDSTITVGEGTPNDAEIRTRITALLDQIDTYANVRVRVTEGLVRLSGTVIDSVAQDELTALIERVDGVVAIENETEVSGSLEERLAPAAERIMERTRNILSNAPIFLIALSAFALVAILGWLLTTRIGIWNRLAPNAFIADVYRAIARIAFIVLGVVLALDILNATALIGAVLGAAGVFGLAIGFAVRDTVENFIASILLSLRQPFRPNDFVDIQGDLGTVARLTSRATILISPEGNHIRIPNATVFKGRIVNYTRHAERRFEFDLGVDADADQAAALATVVDALTGLKFILSDPPVGAWVKEVGDSNVLLAFTGWVDQNAVSFLKARGEAIRTAKNALETAGFGLPEPIYRVRLDGAPLGLPAQGNAEQAERSEHRPATPQTPPEPLQDLPDAADPTKVENASVEAAERERVALNEEENLLDTSNKSE